MPGGSTTTSTNTVNSDPWSGAQPYLKEIMAGAQGAYRANPSFMPFPGSTVVPFSSQTMQSLEGIENQANSGNPLGQAAQTATLGMLNNGGLNLFQQQAGQGFYDLATGAQPNAIAQNLGNYTSGANINGGSPEFLRALDYQSGKTIDDVNRSFSNAGRYGSASHAQAGAEAVGNLRNSAIAQEIARQQGLHLQSNQMLSGEQNQGFQNRMAGYGGLGQLGGQGASQLAQFTGLSPSVYQQQYSPYSQLANVGAQYEDLATRSLQDAINRYYATQQAPWQGLSAYNAIVGGMGQLGKTATETAQQPRNWGLPVGGALQGFQLGGPMGALLGGGLGLLGTFLG